MRPRERWAAPIPAASSASHRDVEGALRGGERSREIPAQTQDHALVHEDPANRLGRGRAIEGRLEMSGGCHEIAAPQVRTRDQPFDLR